MKKMNLCTDPWLPVIRKDGGHALLSLNELYDSMKEVRDLNLAPRERISVMRLLICITQRAMNGPEDEADREECRERIIPESLTYLGKWQSAFDMDNGNGGFLQVPGLEALDAKELPGSSKLDMTLSSGNNTTLFDNNGGTTREISMASCALNLLTFQNFAPCGMTGVAEWAGKATAEKAPDSCPGGTCTAASSLNIFLIGEDLEETIWMNLTPLNLTPARLPFGVPIWEQMPHSADDTAAIENATKTYLGRLVPISRSIRISGENGEYAIIARGLEYPIYNDEGSVIYYEPSMRLTRTQKNKHAIVGANLGKALWRSLPAMLRSSGGENEIRNSVYENEELPESFDIWMGALVLDKAKILGEMESRFPKVGSSIFSQESIDGMVNALEIADKKRSKLASSICSYHSHLSDPFDNKSSAIAHAEEVYWGTLSSRQDQFIRTAIAGSREEDKAWEQLCARAARNAYNLSCPHSTDRQMEAWAKAWKTSTKQQA